MRVSLLAAAAAAVAAVGAAAAIGSAPSAADGVSFSPCILTPGWLCRASGERVELLSPATRVLVSVVYGLNDVYRLLPLARVAAFVAYDVLLRAPVHHEVTLAGDFLTGSLECEAAGGRAMTRALNALGVSVVALGNHEFYNPDSLDLPARLRELDAAVVVSNVRGLEHVSTPLLLRQVEHGGRTLRVAMLGYTTSDTPIEGPTSPRYVFEDVQTRASSDVRAMRERYGADFVFALSHQSTEQNLDLLERTPGLDAVLGGHDHERTRILVDGRRVLLQAGENAHFLSVLEVWFDARSRTYELESRLVDLRSDDLPVHEASAAIARAVLDEIDRDLQQPLALLEHALDNRGVRRRQTTLAGAFCDAMHSSTGADVVLLNAGTTQEQDDGEPDAAAVTMLDPHAPAGGVPRLVHVLTAGHVSKGIRYDNAMVTVLLTGEELQEAVAYAFARAASESYSGLLQFGRTLRWDQATQQITHVAQRMDDQPDTAPHGEEHNLSAEPSGGEAGSQACSAGSVPRAAVVQPRLPWLPSPPPLRAFRASAVYRVALPAHMLSVMDHNPTLLRIGEQQRDRTDAQLSSADKRSARHLIRLAIQQASSKLASEAAHTCG